MKLWPNGKVTENYRKSYLVFILYRHHHHPSMLSPDVCFVRIKFYLHVWLHCVTTVMAETLNWIPFRHLNLTEAKIDISRMKWIKVLWGGQWRNTKTFSFRTYALTERNRRRRFECEAYWWCQSLFDWYVHQNDMTGNCAGRCMSLNPAFGNLPQCCRRCHLELGTIEYRLCVRSLANDPSSEFVPSKMMFNFIYSVLCTSSVLEIFLFFTSCTSVGRDCDWQILAPTPISFFQI